MTGWSHKYATLLEDYACPDCMLSPSSSEEQIAAALDRLTDGGPRAVVVAAIAKAAEDQKARARQMWEEVDAVLGAR